MRWFKNRPEPLSNLRFGGGFFFYQSTPSAVCHVGFARHHRGFFFGQVDGGSRDVFRAGKLKFRWAGNTYFAIRRNSALE